MEFITLNNKTKAPKVGIGTFLMSPADAEQAVFNALRNGYRLIDTANAYMNEKAVGRGIAKSGVAREDIYLVTKLWPSVYADADRAIDETLARLGTDYVDLLFLHQPAGDYVGAYKAMERAVKAGKITPCRCSFVKSGQAASMTGQPGSPMWQTIRSSATGGG